MWLQVEEGETHRPIGSNKPRDIRHQNRRTTDPSVCDFRMVVMMVTMWVKDARRAFSGAHKGQGWPSLRAEPIWRLHKALKRSTIILGGNVRRVVTKPSPAPSPRHADRDMQKHAEEGPSVIRRIHAMPDVGGQPLPRSDLGSRV